MINFLKEFILASITWVLKPPVHIATFTILLFTHGFDAFNYFDNMGLGEDIRSSSENRALWNFLFVKKNGFRFVINTIKTISWHIGINFLIKKLTFVGYIIYYILYALDFTSWSKGGHCINSVKDEDYEIIMSYKK